MHKASCHSVELMHHAEMKWTSTLRSEGETRGEVRVSAKLHRVKTQILLRGIREGKNWPGVNI